VALLGLAMVLVSAGCSATRFPGDRSARQATVIVDNSDGQYGAMTVHLVAQGGQRQRLGIVTLKSVEEFSVNHPSTSPRYQLLAAMDGGYNMNSPAFVLTEGDVIRWDMRLNQIQFVGRESGGA
jgi:hypothetical protein